jgi:imidazolonepropionase-like amidohydrolase
VSERGGAALPSPARVHRYDPAGHVTVRTRLTADRLVTADGPVYADGAALLVESDTIVAAGPAEDVPTAAVDETYSLPGHTLLPGLVDGHVHLGTAAHPDIVEDTLRVSPAERTLRAVENARATVTAGITTVRDLASLDDTAIAVRDAVERGAVAGPRIVAAGNGIHPTAGHGSKTPWYWPDAIDDNGRWRVADGVTEVRTAVREQIQLDADLIKVWATGGVIDPEGIDVLDYSRAEVDALVDEAARHGRPVAAHAHAPDAIQTLVDSGVRSIEHGTYMERESIDHMAANDVAVTLTRSTIESITELDGVPPHYSEHAEQALERQASQLAYADDRGVLAMGTDTGAVGQHHGDNAEELVHMVDHGVDPLDAIRISTRDTAAVLGLGDVTGRLRPGYAADIVAVDGDPTDDVSLLADDDAISLVVADGRFVRETI